MKNKTFISLVVTLCLTMLSTTFYAQITNVWIGGCPGHENDWNYYKNWSNSQVPDWSSDVIIPNKYMDSQHFPVVSGQEIEVNSLYIHSGAELTIGEDALFSILNDEYRMEAYKNSGEIVILGNLKIEGEIVENAMVLKKYGIVINE